MYIPWWSDDLFNTQIPTMGSTHFLSVAHAVQNRNKYVTDTTTSEVTTTTTTTEQPGRAGRGGACEGGIRRVEVTGKPVNDDNRARNSPAGHG